MTQSPLSAAQLNRNRQVLAALMGLAGLVLIALGVREGWNQFAVMHRWPKAGALVLSSDLAHAESVGTRNSYVTVYWPVVRLEYSVQGKHYVGLAHYAAKSDIRSDWQPVVDDLKPGTTHSLPYDPKDPSDIRIGVRWNFANLGLAGFLILPGAVLALIALGLLASRGGSTSNPSP